MGIRNYEVTVPPTSGEVEELVLDALSRRKPVPVRIRAAGEDIPRSADELDLAFHVGQTGHPEGGGMAILGHTATGETVNLQIAADPDVPATLSLVAPD
jgi:hypothetical protein